MAMLDFQRVCVIYIQQPFPLGIDGCVLVPAKPRMKHATGTAYLSIHVSIKKYKLVVHKAT